MEKGEVIQDDQETAKELNTFFSSSFSFTLKENSTYGSFLYQTYLFSHDARIVQEKRRKKKINFPLGIPLLLNVTKSSVSYWSGSP